MFVAEAIFVLGIVVACGLIYIAPLIIAARRGHHQRVPIALLNILLGWTFLGWVVALIWATSAIDPNQSDALTRSIDQGGA